MNDQNTTISLNDQIHSYSTNLENWQPLTKVSEIFPQFTHAQLRRLFWQRAKHTGLEQCYRRVGKQGYVCIPLFGLWLAGGLAEQQAGGE